jgi:hypothetical protein
MVAFCWFLLVFWCFLHFSSYNFYSLLPSLSSPIIPTIPHQPHGSYHLVFPCHVDHHPHCHLNILSLLVKPICGHPPNQKAPCQSIFLPRMFGLEMHDQFMSHLGMSFQDLDLATLLQIFYYLHIHSWICHWFVK